MIFLFKSYLFTITALALGLWFLSFMTNKEMRRELTGPFMGCLFLSQAISFLSPNIFVCNTLTAAVIPIFARKRHHIGPMYLFLVLTLPLFPAQIVAGGIFWLSYDQGISVALGALAAAMMLPRRQRVAPVPWSIPVILLLLILVLSSARSTSFTNFLRVLLDNVLQFGLPLAVISTTVRTKEEFKFLAWGLVAASAAMSALAIYEMLHTWPIYRAVSTHYGGNAVGGLSVKVRAGLLRSPGPYPEPTSFALILAIGLIAAFSHRRIYRGVDGKWMTIALLAVGIFAPQSRNGWFGVIAGIFVYQLYSGRIRALMNQAGVLVAAAIGLLVVSRFSPRVAELSGFNGQNQGTVDYRANLFDRGLDEIWKHPLLGQTPEQVINSMSDLITGEGIVDFVNSYLYIGLISGVAGLVVFLIALAMPITSLLSVKSRLKQAAVEYREAAGFIFASVSAMILMIAFTSIGSRTTTILVVLMTMTTSLVAQVQREASIARRKAAAGQDPDDPVPSTLPAAAGA